MEDNKCKKSIRRRFADKKVEFFYQIPFHIDFTYLLCYILDSYWRFKWVVSNLYLFNHRIFQRQFATRPRGDGENIEGVETSMKKITATLLALILALSMLPMQVLAASYSDIDGHWAEDAIERWSDYGVIQGNRGRFQPYGTLTRAHLATILARLLALPEAESAGFTDTDGHWAEDAIDRCAAAGILLGDNGKAYPDAPVTRQQAMTMIARALGYRQDAVSALEDFLDADRISGYAAGYLAALVNDGVVLGHDGYLEPYSNINRGQMVAIIDRMIDHYANRDGQTLSAESGGYILVVAKNVTLTDVPAGTVVVVTENAAGLTVNGVVVAPDQEYIVPEKSPASDCALPHKHSYDETTLRCSCGDFRSDVAATVNDESGYTNLAAALAAAESGDTVKLLKDATLNETQKINDGKTLTVDLNGNNITFGTRETNFEVSHGTLNLTGSGTVKESAPYLAPVVVYGSTNPTAEGYSVVNVGEGVTLQGWSGLMIRQYNKLDTTSTSTAAYGVEITVNGTIRNAADSKGIYGGSIYVNGNIQNTTGNVPEITLTSDSKVYSEDCAIYAAGYARWNLAGTISGVGGIEAKAGVLNITGGSVTATAEDVEHEASSNGGSTTGYAIAAVENRSYAGYVRVNISGGTVTGTVGTVNDDDDETSNTATLSITGGTFSADPSTYVASGCEVSENSGVYTVTAPLAGKGTEAEPFQVASSDDFKALGTLCADGASYYFRQTADIVVAVGDEVTRFAGVYDGGNHKLSSAHTSETCKTAVSLFNIPNTQVSGHITIKNLEVTMDEVATNLLLTADWNTAYGADFENITFSSKSGKTAVANNNNFGLVLSNSPYTAGDAGEAGVVYNFKNITNNVSIENEGISTGVFIGSGPYFETETTLNFVNCTNTGNVTGTSYVGYLYGNGSYDNLFDANGTINIMNCSNTGTLRGIGDGASSTKVALAPMQENRSTKLAQLIEGYQESVGGTYTVGNDLKGKSVTVSQDDTSFGVTVEDSESYTYQVVLNVQATYWTNDGEAWDDDDVTKLNSTDNKVRDAVWTVSNGRTYRVAPTAGVTGELKSFHAYDARNAKTKGLNLDDDDYNAEKYAFVVDNNTCYLVFNYGNDYYIDSAVSVWVYAYGESGALVGTKQVQ